MGKRGILPDFPGSHQHGVIWTFPHPIPGSGDGSAPVPLAPTPSASSQSYSQYPGLSQSLSHPRASRDHHSQIPLRPFQTLPCSMNFPEAASLECLVTPRAVAVLGALCSQIPWIPSRELAQAWSSLLPNPTAPGSGITPFAPYHQIQQDPEPLDDSRGTTSATGWESGISSEGSRDGKSTGTGIFPFQIPPAPYPCSQPPAIPKVDDSTQAFPRFPFLNLPCSTGEPRRECSRMDLGAPHPPRPLPPSSPRSAP